MAQRFRVRDQRKCSPPSLLNFPRSAPVLLLHVLLYALLCAAPALVLLPVRWLDRPPSNETIHEQPSEDDQDHDGDAGPMLAAA